MSIQEPFHKFVGANTESSRVMVATPNYEMEGNVFLSRSMKESRRLTNLLNGDKRFLALTDVKITQRKTGVPEEALLPYVHVNLDTIELIKPISVKGSEELELV